MSAADVALEIMPFGFHKRQISRPTPITMEVSETPCPSLGTRFESDAEALIVFDAR